MCKAIFLTPIILDVAYFCVSEDPFLCVFFNSFINSLLIVWIPKSILNFSKISFLIFASVIGGFGSLIILSTHNLISGIISLLCCPVRIKYNPLFKALSVCQYILRSTEAESLYTLQISFLSFGFSIRILLRYAFCSLSKCWYLFLFINCWCSGVEIHCKFCPVITRSSISLLGVLSSSIEKLANCILVRQRLMSSNSSILFSQEILQLWFVDSISFEFSCYGYTCFSLSHFLVFCGLLNWFVHHLESVGWPRMHYLHHVGWSRYHKSFSYRINCKYSWLNIYLFRINALFSSSINLEYSASLLKCSNNF